MWTLGFDTTSDTVTAALIKDTALMASFSASAPSSHSAALLPVIEQLISYERITPKDIGLISCSQGPGSFTGVRIGIATAKGLAAANNIPCVGVSSLEALANMFAEIRGTVCTVIDARRSNVYGAFFYSDGTGRVERLTNDELISLEVLPDMICSIAPDGIYLTGDGLALAENVLPEKMVLKTPEMLRYQNGYGVAILGYKLYNDKNTASEDFSHEKLSPIYLGRSRAEL